MRLLKSLPAAALLMILPVAVATGCATGSSDPKDVSFYCTVAKPITGYADADPALVTQIETHNSDWVCACEKDCK